MFLDEFICYNVPAKVEFIDQATPSTGADIIDELILRPAGDQPAIENVRGPPDVPEIDQNLELVVDYDSIIANQPTVNLIRYDPSNDHPKPNLLLDSIAGNFQYVFYSIIS